MLDQDQKLLADYLMIRIDIPVYKNYMQSFKSTLPPEVSKPIVHNIVRIMLQTIFYIADLNYNKGIFHGNKKEERIYMAPCGLKGFMVGTETGFFRWWLPETG